MGTLLRVSFMAMPYYRYTRWCPTVLKYTLNSPRTEKYPVRLMCTDVNKVNPSHCQENDLLTPFAPDYPPEKAETRIQQVTQKYIPEVLNDRNWNVESLIELGLSALCHENPFIRFSGLRLTLTVHGDIGIKNFITNTDKHSSALLKVLDCIDSQHGSSFDTTSYLKAYSLYEDELSRLPYTPELKTGTSTARKSTGSDFPTESDFPTALNLRSETDQTPEALNAGKHLKASEVADTSDVLPITKILKKSNNSSSQKVLSYFKKKTQTNSTNSSSLPNDYQLLNYFTNDAPEEVKSEAKEQLSISHSHRVIQMLTQAIQMLTQTGDSPVIKKIKSDSPYIFCASCGGYSCEGESVDKNTAKIQALSLLFEKLKTSAEFQGKSESEKVHQLDKQDYHRAIQMLTQAIQMLTQIGDGPVTEDLLTPFAPDYPPEKAETRIQQVTQKYTPQVLNERNWNVESLIEFCLSALCHENPFIQFSGLRLTLTVHGDIGIKNFITNTDKHSSALLKVLDCFDSQHGSSFDTTSYLKAYSLYEDELSRLAYTPELKTETSTARKSTGSNFPTESDFPTALNFRTETDQIPEALNAGKHLKASKVADTSDVLPLSKISQNSNNSSSQKVLSYFKKKTRTNSTNSSSLPNDYQLLNHFTNDAPKEVKAEAKEQLSITDYCNAIQKLTRTGGGPVFKVIKGHPPYISCASFGGYSCEGESVDIKTAKTQALKLLYEKLKTSAEFQGKSKEIQFPVQKSEKLDQQDNVLQKRVRKKNPDRKAVKKQQQQMRHSILSKILSWDPNHVLHDVEETGPEMSNIIDISSVREVMDRYETYEEYWNTIEPLFLMDVCNQISKEFQQDYRQGTFMQLDTVNVFDGGLQNGVFVHLRFKGKMSREFPDLYRSDLTIVDLTVFRGERKKVFGLVEKITFEGQKPSKPGQKEECFVLVQTFFSDSSSLNFDMDWHHFIRPVGNLTTAMRSIEALCYIPHSGFLGDILSPKPETFIGPTCIRSTMDWNVDNSFNESQAKGVALALDTVLQPNHEPKIVMLHGPPGTGKSKTIVELCTKLIKEGKKMYRDMKILVCAPSNAAIDELAYRLLVEKRESADRTVRAMNVWRVGNAEMVDPSVMPMFLPQVVQEQMNDEGISSDTELDFRIRKVLQKADIICSTLASCAQFKMDPLRNSFDCIIVDEATQCTELELLITLQYDKAHKLVLVGDPEQLPPTVLSMDAVKYGYQQSLFERFYYNLENHQPPKIHLLDTQYRMHPEIAKFPSKFVYDGKIKTGSCVAERSQLPLQNYLIFNLKFPKVSEHLDSGTQSYMNKHESDAVLTLCKTIRTKFAGFQEKPSIGIITFYKAQKDLLKKSLTRSDLLRGDVENGTIEVNTVDGFQGRQKDIVILSCVRANKEGITGFVKDRKRLNVSITRAKHALYIIGHLDTLQNARDWNELITDALQREKIKDIRSVAELNRIGRLIDIPTSIEAEL